MEKLMQENKKLKDRLEGMMQDDYCCICDQPMCPHRDQELCKNCKRSVCY